MNGPQVAKFDIDGPLLLTPPVYRDERGYFLEAWRRDHYRDLGLDVDFVQTNTSRSRRGTLRGLHFQRAPHAQGKLVSVVRGKILDVAVDLRRASPTYGHYVSSLLDDEKHARLWVPRGFAHGFLAISEFADVVYQVDAVHAPDAEGGVRWDDPQLAVEWQLDEYLEGAKPLVSPRDAALPLLGDGVEPLEAT